MQPDIRHDTGAAAEPVGPWAWAPPVLTRTRQLAVAAVGGAVLAAVTAILVAARGELDVSTGLSLYLLVVVAVSALGGRLVGVAAAVVSPFLANWFLIEPYHTLRVAEAENLVELMVFVSVAVIVSAFVAVAARRAGEAEQARREAATLATLAGTGGPSGLPAITELLGRTFGLDGVAILRTGPDGTDAVAVHGEHPPIRRADGDVEEPLGPGVVLRVRGRVLTSDERRVLGAFIGRLRWGLEQHELARRAAEADAIARADELRTAILRSVSHDLRSPLAGIKASVSSLRQPDIDWPDDVRADFLGSIEAETDRLTAIVTNLLDMSRLQAGAVRPALRRVAIEEVVPAALHSIGAAAASVDLTLPSGLCDVLADPALLERVVANLVGNAVAWSPAGERVRVLAHRHDDQVQLHIVDHGPGIDPRERDVVRRPFHRHDDSSRHGVGLGLAIADGLTRSMGGELDLRDTPRGGLTAVVTLPAAP